MESTPTLKNFNVVRPGILWMLLSACSVTLIAVCIKLAGPRVSVEQAVFFRTVLTLPFIIGFAKLKNESVWGSKRKLLMVRGFVGAVGLQFYTYATLHLPLSLLTLLVATSPILIAFLSFWISKEKTRGVIWGTLPIFLLGLILILKPSFQTHTLAILAAIITALTSAIAQLLVRNLRTTDHPRTIVFYFNFFSVLLSLPFLFSHWKTLPFSAYVFLSLAGVFALMYQLSMTYAYRHEPANVLSVYAYFGPVLGLILGVVFFKETPDVYALLGTTLIILSGIYVARKTSG